MSNPKLILIICCVCLLATSIFFVTRNSSGNVDRVLSAHSYSVYIDSCTCYGCAEETLSIVKNQADTSAELTFYDLGQKNTNIKRYKKISWGGAKEKLLRTIFINGINDNSTDTCTTHTLYKLYSFPFSVEWEGNNCRYNKMMDELLN